jgi:hypothetical protein
METDKVNYYFSSEVYEIKNGKYDKEDVLDGLSVKYKILETEDNKDNGMQAMAVAPVDSNGEVEILLKLNKQIKRV